MAMPTVTFLPSGRTAEARAGATLLGVIRGAGLPIGYACRGRGVCLACRVRVTGPLAAPDVAERALLDRIADPGPWRIACLARLAGDATVQADYW
ncbi:MAG: (2Fe-2S)-binding protein [Myxococcales bacterium]|nr:(2Fe-2S)-binding protein [Myxococcales bacterium]